ncbi:unnamed protein product [Amoebophrya sp. A120]|nr:unnamed protein product [Amoebophrya sp. A120]|eukprot:GSA120T00023371001.1
MSRPAPRSTFQKPENALRRAKELDSVGNHEDALALLGDVMGNRKFKNSNTLHVMEQIAIFALAGLSVPLKDLKSARDILINYRSMTQTTATSSLEKVVREFRSAAEKLVTDSKEKASSLAKGLDDAPEDLETLDTPDNALRKALKPKNVREQEKKEREVLENIRFMWETYKQILDVFKTNGKTEDLYNETAQRALTFCMENRRTNEFKKLCDLLRNNYQNLFKRASATGVYPPHAVNPTDKDTIGRTIDTRCFQLKVSGELALWKECFNTAEDLYSLMTKKKPRAATLAQYYDFLSQICFKSGSFLFHAYALVRNYTLHKINQKSFQGEEKTRMASIAVLATMCVSGHLHETGESFGPDQAEVEKLRRMAQLFNVATVPTKNTLKTDLQIREILIDALPAVRKLYQLIELAPQVGKGFLYSKDICAKCKPMLDELRANPDTAVYCDQLQKVIFFRLLGQLARVYSTMTVEQLKKLCQPIVDFPTAEKWMISSARDSGVHVQLDYVRAVVVFANKTSNDLSTLRQPLINMSDTTLGQLAKVFPGLEQSRKADQRSELFGVLKDKKEKEQVEIENRVNEIERRNKEKAENEKVEQERKERQVLQQKARDQKDTQARLEAEKKRRADEAAKSRRNDLDKRRMMEVIEELRKIYYEQNIKIGEYNLNDISEQDLEKLELTFIEQERTRIIQKDRTDKVRQRKQEAKRVDHLARAFRLIAADKIPEKAELLREEQEEILAKLEEEKIAAAKLEFERNSEKKKLAIAALAGIKAWQDVHIGKREVEYQEKLRLKQKQEWEKKCMRAVRAYMMDMEQKEREREEAEEEERLMREAEEKEAKEQADREARLEARKAQEAEREQNNRDMDKGKREDKGGKSSAPHANGNSSNWRDEEPRGGDKGKSSMKANGDSGKFSSSRGDKDGKDGKGSSFGKSDRFGGKDNKDSRKDDDRDFGNLRDRGSNERSFDDRPFGAKRGDKGKGKNDRRMDDGDDWRGARGGAAPERGEKEPPAEKSEEGGAGARPIPAWKKYAMEKKKGAPPAEGA